MSDIEAKNLPPAPYFARFLEGQETRTMSAEEMKAVDGGQYVTLRYPSDSDAVDHLLPKAPSVGSLMGEIRGKLGDALGEFPGYPTPEPQPREIVTLAYPSDSDVVGG